MDIRRWVSEAQDELTENGRARLAELVQVIPRYVVSQDHARVDAAVPEALALAREAKHAWLELYIRHWNLQSRVLHRHEVATHLSEAISLVDFARRDEARECPQSVCATRDLAGCYAKIDGPGYAEERLAIAKETLGRIDARRPCFSCISSEYALAQIDGGDREGALTFLDAQAAELAAVAREQAARQLAGARIEALLQLGRADEVLALAREARAEATDENDRTRHALDAALALARLGRVDEAKAELPPFDRVLPTHSFYERWSQATYELAKRGAIANSFRLDAQLGELAGRLRDNGVIRLGIDLEERRARLAIARGRPETAEACLAAMREALPLLRAPLGIDQTITDLAREVDEALKLAREQRAAEPADTGASVLDRLTQDPERDLVALRAARERDPDDERIVIMEAAALSALRRAREADALLRAELARRPDALGCLLALGQSLLQRREPTEARALAESTLARDPGPLAATAAHWLTASAWRLEGQRAKARPHLEAIVALARGGALPADPRIPDALQAEIFLAAIEREEGDTEAALARLDRLVIDHPTPGEHDWERLVAATLLDRWDTVRDSARRLGMPVEGEGPIDESWSLCRVEFPEEGGSTSIHHAIRTGPVTARVIEVAPPRAPQHYGDEVVFDATPKNAPPAPGEERGHTYLYTVIARRKAGAFQSFVIDGAHPGDDALVDLRESLGDLGCFLSVRSDDSYQITAPTPLRGLFGYLAIPAWRPLADVHALLVRLSMRWAHPLIWPGLAQALELDEEMTKQAEIIERYGL